MEVGGVCKTLRLSLKKGGGKQRENATEYGEVALRRELHNHWQQRGYLFPINRSRRCFNALIHKACRVRVRYADVFTKRYPNCKVDTKIDTQISDTKK